MGKGILTFRGIEIEKDKFYYHKSPIFSKDLEIEKYYYLTRFLLVKKSY